MRPSVSRRLRERDWGRPGSSRSSGTRSLAVCPRPRRARLASSCAASVLGTSVPSPSTGHAPISHTGSPTIGSLQDSRICILCACQCKRLSRLAHQDFPPFGMPGDAHGDGSEWAAGRTKRATCGMLGVFRRDRLVCDRRRGWQVPIGSVPTTTRDDECAGGPEARTESIPGDGRGTERKFNVSAR